MKLEKLLAFDQTSWSAGLLSLDAVVATFGSYGDEKRGQAFEVDGDHFYFTTSVVRCKGLDRPPPNTIVFAGPPPFNFNCQMPKVVS